jgi:hypothetical protein
MARYEHQQQLFEALDTIYPVLHTLVGDRFFTLLVGQYATQSGEEFNAPHTARFGSRFGQLLLKQYIDHPELDKFAVLAELARMEWLCHDVSHPAETGPAVSPEISEAPDGGPDISCLQANPGLRMMYSYSPLLNIWQAYCAGRMDRISSDGGHQWLCIFHDSTLAQSEVQIEALEEPEAAILGAVLKGCSPAEIDALPAETKHCLPTLIKRHWLDCVC